MISNHIIADVINEIDQKELIDLTGKLVKINSVWDPMAGTSEQAVAELVAKWARIRGFRVETDQVASGRPNVVITLEMSPGKRTLMFEGHTDVVTPGDNSAWIHDPFGAEIVGQRMYGRGTNDTKGNLAAMLIAMAALKNSGVELAGTIIGGVICDEEDRMLGIQDFIKRGRADSVTGAIICEPQDGLICNAQKGAIRARYIIAGRMSHGAMPLFGLNTAPAVSRLIDGLHELELDAMNTMGRDEHLGWPSFTPTVIQAPIAGSPQLNVIPQSAQISVDVRTIPNQSHKKIMDQMRNLAENVGQQVRSHYSAYDNRTSAKRSREVNIEVEFLTDRPCTLTDMNDPVVQAADWATRRVINGNPVYGGVLGSTDGTFLWALKDIPIVTMGAGDRQVAHQVNEWVDLNQLLDTSRIYALTALHYLFPETGDA